MENRYCSNCGEAYDSIPKNISPFFNEFKGWDIQGHKCKDILSPFLTFNEEGREFKDKEQEMEFRGINHWNEMSYTKIGTFCEKCRQVVCICADIANKWVSSSLLEGLHYKNMMTSSIFESKPTQILNICDDITNKWEELKRDMTVKFTDKGDLVATKTEDTVKENLPALHLEQLLMMIDEFLPEFHPIRHSNSYYYFKTKQK